MKHFILTPKMMRNDQIRLYFAFLITLIFFRTAGQSDRMTSSIYHAHLAIIKRTQIPFLSPFLA